MGGLRGGAKRRALVALSTRQVFAPHACLPTTNSYTPSSHLEVRFRFLRQAGPPNLPGVGPSSSRFFVQNFDAHPPSGSRPGMIGVACASLPKLISNQSFSNSVPRSAPDLNIEVDQVAAATQHTGNGLQVFFLRRREKSNREIDGRATSFGGDLCIRPGGDHSSGIDE